MKKTTYTASVYYLTDGGQQTFENLSAENAEAINAQAHAGLDLHWFAENEGTMYEFLIPREAVLSVVITKSTEEVSAPTDSICDEESPSENPFSLILNDPATWRILHTDNRCTDYGDPIYGFSYNGNTYNWDDTPEVMQALEYDIIVNGHTYQINSEIDCADVPNGETVHVLVVIHFDGVDSDPIPADWVVAWE